MRVLLAGVLPAAARAQPHALVSVGDHRLDVVRGGAGGPAVVFETGLADSLDVWLPMWRTMAEFTTVVAYSRAGFGRSDAGPADHSVPHAAADLHELLHRLPVTPPYILVARSYGSLIARLYTSLYPGDVAGLVLVAGPTSSRCSATGPSTARTRPRSARTTTPCSRNGIHIETARSGHGIQDDEPALVAMAIRFVLDRVRAQ